MKPTKVDNFQEMSINCSQKGHKESNVNNISQKLIGWNMFFFYLCKLGFIYLFIFVFVGYFF